MKLTVLQGAEKKQVQAFFNPERIDGVLESEHGALLQIGMEEVLVAEPYGVVVDELEIAWAERKGMGLVNQFLEPLRGLTVVLPFIVPMLLAKAQAQARKVSVAGDRPFPDGPGPVPTEPDDDNDGGDPVEEHEGTPAEALDAIPASELVLTCRNCNGTFPPSALCPGCGCALVGKG